MASDDLDDAERELIRQHRAAQDEERRKGEADLRVWIRSGAGDEADIPYDKGRKWLQEKFGIDLDDEPVQDTDPKPKAAGKDAPPATPGGEVRRFGRRMA